MFAKASFLVQASFIGCIYKNNGYCRGCSLVISQGFLEYMSLPEDRECAATEKASCVEVTSQYCAVYRTRCELAGLVVGAHIHKIVLQWPYWEKN